MNTIPLMKMERLGDSLYRRNGVIYARLRIQGKRTWRSTHHNGTTTRKPTIRTFPTTGRNLFDRLTARPLRDTLGHDPLGNNQTKTEELSAEDARAEAERDTLRAEELGSNLLHSIPVEGGSSAKTLFQKAPIFGEGGKTNKDGQRDLLDEAVATATSEQQGGFQLSEHCN